MNLGRGIFELITDSSKFDKGIDGAKSKVADFGKVTGALVGGSLGGLTTMLGDLGAAAAKEEANIARLSASLSAAGLSYDKLGGSIERKIAVQTKSFAFADDVQRDSLAALVAVTKNTAQAFDLMGIAMDLARFKGISLAAATDAVIAVSQGRYRALIGLGIAIDETMTKEQALAELQARVAGQAEAAGKGTLADIERTRIAIENMRETVGASVGVFASFATITSGFGKPFTVLGGAVLGLFTTRVTAATTGVRLFGLALRLTPVGMLVTGITALGVGLKILYDKFEGVRDVINGVRDAARQLIPGFAFVSDLLGDTLKLMGLMGDAADAATDDLDTMGKVGASAVWSIDEALKGVAERLGGQDVVNTEALLRRYGADEATLQAVRDAQLNMTGLTKDQRFNEMANQDYAAIEASLRKSILGPMEKVMDEVADMTEQEFAKAATVAGRTPKAHMDALNAEMKRKQDEFEHAMVNVQKTIGKAMEYTGLIDTRTATSLSTHRDRIHALRDAWNEARDAADTYSVRAAQLPGGSLYQPERGGGGGGHLIASFHDGGIVPRSGPANLLAGETVLPRGVAPVTVAPSITLNYSGDGGSAGVASRLAQDVVDITTEQLRQQLRRIGATA